MNRRVIGSLTAASLVICMILVCFPAGSLLVQFWQANMSAEAHEDALAELNKESLIRHLNLARWYNLCLKENRHQKEIMEAYPGIINIGRETMGVVELPHLGWKFPVYHDSKSKNVEYKVTHLSGSSLPVGGKGNHTILYGPIIFSELEENDIFCVHILGETLFYRVEKVRLQQPGDTTGILPVQNEDRCTILTSRYIGSEARKVLIHGIRCEAVYTDPDSREACSFHKSAGYTLLILFIPVMTGWVGKSVRWISGKLNWCRLTNHV